MLWVKLCWLLALLALSSAGLPPPNDSLSTPRIFLSFKGKTPDDDDAAASYTGDAALCCGILMVVRNSDRRQEVEKRVNLYCELFRRVGIVWTWSPFQDVKNPISSLI